jgi:hypothetical protein
VVRVTRVDGVVDAAAEADVFGAICNDPMINVFIDRATHHFGII